MPDDITTALERVRAACQFADDADGSDEAALDIIEAELMRLRDSNWANLADSQRYRAERDEALEALRAIRDDAVDEYAVADAVLSNDYRVGDEWKRFMNRPSEPMKFIHHPGFVHSVDVTCPKCPSWGQESRIDD